MTLAGWTEMKKKITSMFLVLAMLVTLCPVAADQHALATEGVEGVTNAGCEVVSLSLGASHSGAIMKNGDLYCWGNNKYGQVGNGSTEHQTVPVKVLEDVVTLSLGYRHSGAITENGDLYFWGSNSDGEVGNDSTEYQTVPVKVLEDVVALSLGDGHNGAITKNGDLYCWGKNYHGQVGNGS